MLFYSFFHLYLMKKEGIFYEKNANRFAESFF